MNGKDVDFILDVMRMTRDAERCADCGTARTVGEEYYPSDMQRNNLRALCGACKAKDRAPQPTVFVK